ncbi:hypothetical protein JK145_00145 [Sodalis sp. CWE]|nr:hypothetical protein [Sodalis sp. CWE]
MNGIKLEIGQKDQIKRLQRFIEIYPILFTTSTQ